MNVPDQSDNCSAPFSSANGDEGEGEVAETAIPTAATTPIDRRQQYADAAGGYQETATRATRRGFAIPSTGEELHHAKGRWSEDSWQMKALTFINSDAVQKFFICLLVLDVLILFTELAIEAYFPSCRLVIRDAISCCPADDGSDGAHAENDMHRVLGGGGDDSHICTYPLIETSNQAGCDDHKYPGVHVAHEALFWVTIVILVTFEVELFLMIYLLGPEKFFHQLIYVVDLFIVTLSLVLELLFRAASNQLNEVLPGILIIFRMWRFVRIGHGLVASTYEVQEHKTELAMEHIEELEERLKKHEEEVPERPEKLRRSE
mmetsp:Transcript_23055/g.42325  ORF Transcript_23055/g.42325 Transcript_23055/m.42325 type:complete len:319 (-) Transcript_23055:469-1425(-)